LLPQLTEVTTVGVWGPVASGKSHLLKQWISGMGRVLVNDVTGSLIGDDSVTHFWQTPKAMGQHLKENPYRFRVAYHPGGNIEQDFRWCFHLAWVMDAPRWLVCDEMWQIAPNEGPHVSDEISLLARMPRHVKLGFIGASQRLQDISTVLRSGMRMNVFFHMEQDRELRAVAETWGNETADAVRELRPLIYDDASEQTHQVPECLVKFRGKPAMVYDLAGDQSTSEKDVQSNEKTLDNESTYDKVGNNETRGMQTVRTQMDHSDGPTEDVP